MQHKLVDIIFGGKKGEQVRVGNKRKDEYGGRLNWIVSGGLFSIWICERMRMNLWTNCKTFLKFHNDCTTINTITSTRRLSICISLLFSIWICICLKIRFRFGWVSIPSHLPDRRVDGRFFCCSARYFTNNCTCRVHSYMHECMNCMWKFPVMIMWMKLFSSKRLPVIRIVVVDN